MQQKVAIAAALIADPPLLLLDEPTLGLDVQAARSIKDLLARLVRDDGKTIVLTTHQLGIAQDVCDRIAVMSRGQLIADYPTADLLGLFRQEFYEIRVGGPLSASQQAAFSGLTITCENGQTTLSGLMPDQASLYAVLEQVQRLDLPLIAVQQVTPDLEEIFLKLLKGA
jgi:ABC-2 type transport system ATP-binding protein